jgi:hypothetical protein
MSLRKKAVVKHRTQAGGVDKELMIVLLGEERFVDYDSMTKLASVWITGRIMEDTKLVGRIYVAAVPPFSFSSKGAKEIDANTIIGYIESAKAVFKTIAVTKDKQCPAGNITCITGNLTPLLVANGTVFFGYNAQAGNHYYSHIVQYIKFELNVTAPTPSQVNGTNTRPPELETKFGNFTQTEPAGPPHNGGKRRRGGMKGGNGDGDGGQQRVLTVDTDEWFLDFDPMMKQGSIWATGRITMPDQRLIGRLFVTKGTPTTSLTDVTNQWDIPQIANRKLWEYDVAKINTEKNDLVDPKLDANEETIAENVLKQFFSDPGKFTALFVYNEITFYGYKIHASRNMYDNFVQYTKFDLDKIEAPQETAKKKATNEEYEKLSNEQEKLSNDILDDEKRNHGNTILRLPLPAKFRSQRGINESELENYINTTLQAQGAQAGGKRKTVLKPATKRKTKTVIKPSKRI